MTTLNTITTKISLPFAQHLGLFVAIATLLGSSTTTFAIPITSGLVLHLDASDPLNNGGGTLPANGSSPDIWFDTSGQNNDAGDTTESTHNKDGDPNWIADGGAAWNNQPVFRFDGNDGYRIFETNNTTDPLGLHGGMEATVFTIINPQGNSVDGNVRWFGQTSVKAFGHMGSPWQIQNSTTPLNAAGSLVSGTAISSTSSSFILASTMSNLQRNLYTNGALDGTDNTDRLLDTFNTDAPKGVGAYANYNSNNISFYFTGDVAEVIVFDRALSSLELNAVGVFLQNKYGIDGQFANPVPEPSTGLVMMLGIAAMSWYRRRSRLCFK